MKPSLDIPAIFPEVAMIADDTLRGGVISVWQELWQELSVRRYRRPNVIA